MVPMAPNKKKATAKSCKSTAPLSPVAVASAVKSTPNVDGSPKSKPRTDEDKAAGTILIGFLSSLRDSYEQALRTRTGEQRHEPSVIVNECTTTTSNSDDARSSSDRNGANVTDWSSSQQPESSVEDSDWNSDKKTDPSSSEDSDKDEKEAPVPTGHEPPPSAHGKGPPRKRLKRIAMESSHHHHIHHHHRE